MKKVLILITIIFFTNPTFAQKITETKLLGIWRLGFEDYEEFIYHKVEAVKFSYLKDNPKGKIVARICSKDNKISVAMANSVGFAFNLPFYTKTLQISDDKVLFARSSKCHKSEEYWFVPENISLEYDEIISAEKVKVNRYLVVEESHQKPNLDGFKSFTKLFIEELKNNPKAEGFIILNIQTKKRYLQQALQQIQREKIDKTRFQILRKRMYESNFPEFMTVSVDN